MKEQTLREAFEEMAASMGWNIRKRIDGSYADKITARMWLVAQHIARWADK